MTHQESGEWLACTEEQWHERQTLAYFINFHILSKGCCGLTDICTEIGIMFCDPWYPGARIARLHPNLTPTPAGGQVPYNPHHNFMLDLLNGSPRRLLLPEDTRLSNHDSEWEIYPKTLKAASFLNGRKHWIQGFDTYCSDWWRALAIKIQKGNGLTHKDIWSRIHSSPDKVCGPEFQSKGYDPMTGKQLSKAKCPALKDTDRRIFHDSLKEHLCISNNFGLDRSTRNCADKLLERAWNNESRKFNRMLDTWAQSRNEVDRQLSQFLC
jgi:hypothetical protein